MIDLAAQNRGAFDRFVGWGEQRLRAPQLRNSERETHR